MWHLMAGEKDTAAGHIQEDFPLDQNAYQINISDAEHQVKANWMQVMIAVFL